MTSLFQEITPGAADEIPVREITVTVNGQRRSAMVEPRLMLAHLLRQGFHLTGTHTGCDTTNCGACTVLVDGRPVKSCTMLAVQADGHEVMTVEGLAGPSELHAIQEGFKEEHGLQCGFCTPGLLMSLEALLPEETELTETAIREAFAGKLCRCTGYGSVVAALELAHRRVRGETRINERGSPSDMRRPET
jgi:carbon-monoxide dehydrogenase small subunit